MARFVTMVLLIIALWLLMEYDKAHSEPACPEVIAKVDDVRVPLETLTRYQEQQLRMAQGRCQFIYPASICVKEIRFYPKRFHIAVICAAEETDNAK